MVKQWNSIHKKTQYYIERYGHLFYPVRDFNDLLERFKKIGEIDPEDAFPLLHTWKLAEDYEDRFVLSCRTGGDFILFYDIFTGKFSAKHLKSVGWDTFWEFPKVKAPKEKEEIPKIPKIEEEKREIYVDNIFVPPDYIRKYINPDHVNRIAGSMNIDGQVEPIVVVPREYAKDLEKKYPELRKYSYILLKGLHRLQAVKMLKQDCIIAIVKFNNYKKERRKAFSENVLTNEISIYEKALEVKRFRDEGATEEEIANEFKVSKSYISKLLSIANANFKEDWKDKEYVLTAFTYPAFESLMLIKYVELRRMQHIVKRSIEEFSAGRIFNEGDIERWSKELFKEQEEKEKEIQRKIIGEEIQSASQIQAQIEKPIAIPKEIKEKEIKKGKEKAKTPEERFNKKSKSYKYFYGEEFDFMSDVLLNYIKDHDIPFSRIGKLQAYCRECNREAWKFSQEKLSKQDKEELYRRFYNIADKFFKGELK